MCLTTLLARLTLTAVALSSTISAQFVDRSVAIVGDQSITASEVALQARLEAMANGVVYVDSLELRDASLKWLKQRPVSTYQGPRVMFELGYQHDVIGSIFAENEQWKRVMVHKDRFEVPRWVEAFLV